MTLNLVNSMEKDENNKFTDNAITVGNNFNVDYNGNLKCTNANISGTINATAGKIGDCNIEDGTLKIAQANISEKLTASVIDVDNLNVNSANIANSVSAGWVYAGNITAEQISGGTINGEVVYAGTISADNITSGTMSANRISGGTIDADTITVKNLNASNLTKGLISANRISDASNYLTNLYATNVYTAINYAQTVQLVSSGAAGLENNGTVLKPNGVYIKKNGSATLLATWQQMADGGTTTTKTAVFG